MKNLLADWQVWTWAWPCYKKGKCLAGKWAWQFKNGMGGATKKRFFKECDSCKIPFFLENQGRGLNCDE